MAVFTTGAANAAKSSHWYTQDGTPAHRQAKADGLGDRATTITDARRLRLLPSVTSILSILDKPALGVWKAVQLLKAAKANPQLETESEEYWMKRVQDASYEQVGDAAELGSKIHDALEAYFAGERVPVELRPWVKCAADWIESKGLRITTREHRVVSHEYGFAGTADVFFSYGRQGIGILDYKTKKTKPGEKVISYLEHKCQLSAYAAAHYGVENLDRVIAANLFISSTEPGRLEVVKHDEVRKYWDIFAHLCAVWRGVKEYDPRAATANRMAA